MYANWQESSKTTISVKVSERKKLHFFLMYDEAGVVLVHQSSVQSRVHTNFFTEKSRNVLTRTEPGASSRSNRPSTLVNW